MKKGGRLLETAVYADPWNAYAAMCATLAAEYPAGPPPVGPSEAKAAREESRERRVTLADFMPAA